MEQIPTTPMDATGDFFNCSGDIVETNFSEQQKKTITWADKISISDNESLYTMPSLQCPQYDDDSSKDEYSYSTEGNTSLFHSNDRSSMPILHSSPVSNKANDAITSFPYNGEYWQNWKPLDYQHTSPDEIGTQQQAPNTNVGQKASPDEMESEWQAPNTNIGQKTLLFHINGEHSIDILKVLSSLKTNQLYQKMIMLQSVSQLYDNLNRL